MSEEELLAIGAAFDLDAFIKSLSPPTTDEILSSLAPIPTLEEVLALLDGAALPRPELPEDVKLEVDALKERVDGLRRSGLQGDDTEAQDAALAEALELAERVLAIRERYQSGWTNADGAPATWFEIGDAQRLIDDLRHQLRLPPEGRVGLSAAYRARSESEETTTDQTLAEIGQQLAIRRHMLGDEHPDVARLLNDLGSLLRENGGEEAAEVLYRQAWAHWQASLGGEHPHTVVSLVNLAVSTKQNGDAARAGALTRAALAARCRLLGPDNPDTLNALRGLGDILLDMGAYQDAATVYGRAIATARRVLGPEDTRTLEAIGSMGTALIYMRKAQGSRAVLP